MHTHTHTLCTWCIADKSQNKTHINWNTAAYYLYMHLTYERTHSVGIQINITSFSMIELSLMENLRSMNWTKFYDIIHFIFMNIMSPDISNNNAQLAFIRVRNECAISDILRIKIFALLNIIFGMYSYMSNETRMWDKYIWYKLIFFK